MLLRLTVAAVAATKSAEYSANRERRRRDSCRRTSAVGASNMMFESFSDVAKIFFPGEQNLGIWGQKSPIVGPGAKPWRGSWAKPPEADDFMIG